MTMILKTREDIAAGRELISAPGETLAEVLEHAGLSQKELADRMGRPEKTVSEIIHAKAAITPETAKELEHVLDISAEFWMARENQYQLRLTELKHAESRIENLDWLARFPLAEMARKGWIKTKTKSLDAFEELLTFMGVASPEGFDRTYLQVSQARYRRSLKRATNPYALAVWLRMGEKHFPSCPAEYSRQKFKDCLIGLKELVVSQPLDFRQQVARRCAEVGVVVVHTDCLKNTPIAGATRWINNTPLIQLSTGLKSGDRYWFTFYHEAAHVLMHPTKNVYLEGVEGLEDEAQHEHEANAFAQEFLLPQKAYDSFLGSRPSFSRSAIVAFAKEQHTHPGIVVGRLQIENRLPWNTHLNALKAKVDDESALNPPKDKTQAARRDVPSLN